MRKLLIANRGEIACRIMRTARRMGIATVAVYSDADAEALHVNAADEAVRIGASPATESYLSIDRVMAAAKATGADAIHPGYGFLAENADFADACAEAGIAFVGPSGKAMRALGGKAAAKDIAIAAGVPVVPGYQGAAQGLATLKREAARIGYPVMIKAVAGGGGRGMRRVDRAEDLAELLESARREAASAFGDDRMLVEKLVVAPRHVEVQVFGDRHGNVVHLFERDCSLQRRNQKVIEEAPAPGMSEPLREAITGAAVKLARSVGYEGAGTVEFLVEGGTLGPEAPWYFIEMNTRLQVEHPVTEEITGLDLVEWQLRIADGERLPRTQEQITMCGHAIEARVCAEEPARGFQPSVGVIHACGFAEGEGLRLETGVASGDAISPYYDSMIAKLIASGADRSEALDRLAASLRAARVVGIASNLGFLHELLIDEDVVAGRMDTGLIARKLDRLADPGDARRRIAMGVRALIRERQLAHPPDGEGDPWDAADGFQLGGARRVPLPVDADGRRLTALLTIADRRLDVTVEGAHGHWPGEHVFADAPAIACEEVPGMALARGGVAYVLERMQHTTVAWPLYDATALSDEEAASAVRAPINGRVAKIAVTEGEAVAAGARVAVVEAMKMEHVLTAPRAGVVARVVVREGEQVTQGAVLVQLAEEGGA